MTIIGVDFDNTIVRYDDLFHRIAVERGLVPGDLPVRKNDVRDFLREAGRERDWTELQGYVYGPRMADAQPFPGVLDFFAGAIRRGVSIHIISHKTPVPVVGPPYDLHQTARDWLASKGFFDSSRVGLSPDRVYFGTTRVEKIGLIRRMGCTHFVDDLEETFLEKSFPQGVVQILFGHREAPAELPAVTPLETWERISNYVFTDAT